MRKTWKGKALLTLSLSLAALPSLAANGKAQRIAAKACDADSVLLYGYNNAGSYMSVSTLPAGIYSFQAGRNSAAELEASDGQVAGGDMGFYAKGKFYTVSSDYDWWTGATTTTLTRYDATTWQQEDSHKMAGISFNKGISYSKATGKAYTMMNKGWDPWLYSIDLATYDTASVAPLEASLYYTGLCAGDDGKVYLFNGTTNVMGALDLATGQTTDIGTVDEANNGCASVYDSKLGRIIYTAQVDGEMHIYSLDPTTAAQTEIGTVPGEMYIQGLYIPDVAAGAPDAVNQLAVKYGGEDGTTASISFTAPTTTYGGEALSGRLTATVNIDGTATSVETEAGKVVALTQSLAEGAHTIKVQTANEAGTSPLRRLNTFAGKDVPGPVGDLAFSIDGEGKASLTWEAPTTSKNGGEVDDATVNYRIVREPNSVVVAESLHDTHFEEQLSDAFAHYYYKVTAYADKNPGDTVETEHLTWGAVDVPPFTENFEEWTDFDRFTVVNPLDDGYTGWSNMSGCALSMPNGQTASDYYLFTPAIRLKKSETYSLSFVTSVSSYDDYGAKLEVSLSDDNTTDSQQTVLFDTLTLSGSANTSHYKSFKIASDGNYYLCFHAVSDVNAGQLSLDDIKMTVSSLSSAPDSVAGLSVKAGEKGALTAQLTFTTPTNATDGTPLDGLSKVVAYRGGDSEEAAHTWDAPAKGAVLDWTDTEATEGVNVYRVVAYSNEGKGMDAYAQAFVGNDVPGAVTALKAVAKAGDPSKAVLTWDAPSVRGRNGGYVDPASVRYTVQRMDDINGYYKSSVAEGLEESSYTDEGYTLPDGTRQAIVRYYVSVSNDKGTSPDATVLATLGEPYALPYAESFEGNAYTSSPWTAVTENGKPSWAPANGVLTAVQPYDGDKGMLQFANTGVGESDATLQSPRISLKDAGKASLTFFMYHGAEAEQGDLTLAVSASINDAAPTALATIDYNDGTDGWTRHTIDLGDLTDADNAIFYLKGHALDASAALFIDKVQVGKTLTNDLAVSRLAMPASVTPGEKAEATVEVANMGTADSQAFTVNLYKGSNLVATQQGTALKANADIKLTMPVDAAVADAYETLQYQAEVVADGDEQADNDKSNTVEVYVKGNTLPTVALFGEWKDGKAVLTWNTPTAEAPTPKTDGFEDYKPYALNGFGDWTTHDGDGQMTYYSKYWSKVTNAKGAMAWEVWNMEQAESDGFDPMGDKSSFDPRTGKQCLASFTAIEESWLGDYSVANDNWLISPQVVGGTEVSFWMKSLQSTNKEYIELLVSDTEEVDTDNPDLSTFVVLKADSLTTQDWQEFTATLPVDATRFAIRGCTKTNGYITLLDDVTFTPASGSVKQLTFAGYNVYRDNALVASLVQGNTYADDIDDGQTHTYHVTTVWTDGESTYSNGCKVQSVTAIAQASTRAALVRGGEGTIFIQGGQTAAKATVYTADGKRVASLTVVKDSSLSVAPGIYLVRMGNNTWKVAVK